MPQLEPADVAQFAPVIRGVVAKLAPPDAELRRELVQVAQARVLRCLDRQPAQIPALTFMATYARGAVLNALRDERRYFRRRVWPDAAPDGDGWRDFADERPDPAAVVERDDLRHRLRTVLAALPPDDQELAASIGEGQPMRLLASAAGVTPEAVRQRRQQLLRRLRAALD